MKKLNTDLANFITTYELQDTKLYTDMKEFARYVEYGHTGLCGMTFEGDLYCDLNYSFGYLTKALDAICEKHGVFYEFGNAWNIAFYKN
jgi:hypothetical protein